MPGLKLTSEKYYSNARDSLIKTHNKEINIFDISTISKVSINVGIGKYEAKQKKEIEEYLHKLTGQKPKIIASKVSIAGFKLRKGDMVGLLITLRGKKMHDFLMNLIYLALPRSRDFKGIKNTSFDQNVTGYSLGVENASIFPAVGFDSSVQFGMQINISFKKGSEMNKQFLQELKFPFKK